jgi:hypothetical protein
MRRYATGCALIACSLLGCSAADADRESTADPGTVVVAVPEDGPVQLSAERVATLGSVTGAADSIAFGRVRALELAPNGTVYVLDSQQALLFVFSAGGEMIRRIGGRGEGPGEFGRDATGLALGPDGDLWVADRSNNRYSRFSPAGDLVDTYARSFRASWTFEWDARFDSAGSLWEPASIPASDAETTSSPSLLRLSTGDTAAMTATDTVPRPLAPTREFWEVGYTSTGPGIAEGGQWPIPYQPELEGDLSPRSGYWSGVTAESAFHLQDTTGDTVRTLRRDGVDPLPVTRADREAALQEVRDRFGEQSDVDLSLLSETQPIWTGMFVDDVGRLWVAMNVDADVPPGLTRWEVVDPSGSSISSVDLPFGPSPRPSVRGNLVAGVVGTALGTQTVEVYRIDAL